MLFDSHNHLQSGKFVRPVGEMIPQMQAAGITGCVVNATREADWEAVSALAREFPGYVFPAYGIHPWYADTAAEGWEARLRERLLSDPRASLGEVGVDGWVEAPGKEVQFGVFVKFPLSDGMNHPANLASIAEAYGSRDVLAIIAGNGRRFWGL